MTQEKAATVRHVAATSGMQAAVVDSHLGRLEEERGRAAKARVTRAHMRSLRRERATQDRAFAAAFGRQVRITCNVTCVYCMAPVCGLRAVGRNDV